VKVADPQFDGVVIVTDSPSKLVGDLESLKGVIEKCSHVEYPTGTKNRKFVEDHPRNIPAKFGSNWSSGFGEEA
jgi:hypothetical protein